MGLLVLFIFLFGFFNEIIIAPFIHPNQQAGATPLIVGQGSVAPNGKDEVIIPKINVEIPVDYSQTTTNEDTIENALESGVVHYPTTVLPGQVGNAAFFGHSSNNIFNPGKYKFAFVLLHTLVPGDTFYLTKDHKLYSYKVISKKIVEPSDVSVLNNIPGQTATATLITCDPPGTSLHRLVVVGQQVSPNPAKNTEPTNATSISSIPANLPGNGPNLWQRYIGTIWGKILTTLILLGIAGWLVRRWQNNY
jgi:LPXTG-site transpeptidase (sortase) family protein